MWHNEISSQSGCDGRRKTMLPQPLIHYQSVMCTCTYCWISMTNIQIFSSTENPNRPSVPYTALCCRYERVPGLLFVPDISEHTVLLSLSHTHTGSSNLSPPKLPSTTCRFHAPIPVSSCYFSHPRFCAVAPFVSACSTFCPSFLLKSSFTFVIHSFVVLLLRRKPSEVDGAVFFFVSGAQPREEAHPRPPLHSVQLTFDLDTLTLICVLPLLSFAVLLLHLSLCCRTEAPGVAAVQWRRTSKWRNRL